MKYIGIQPNDIPLNDTQQYYRTMILSETVKHFSVFFQLDVIRPIVVAPKANVESNFRLFNLSSEVFSFLHISLKSNKSFLLVNSGKKL
jgi:hypothetical protein